MHNHTTIDRWSIAYWIAGDGAWSNRWQCTSHDVVLCFIQIITTLWVAWEYYRYAANCERTFSVLPLSFGRRHIEYLRIVLLQCLAIHLCMSVLAWVATPYFFIVALTIWNALSARKLNATNLMQQHAAELLHDDELLRSNDRVLHIITTPTDTTQKLQAAIDVLQQTMAQKGG